MANNNTVMNKNTQIIHNNIKSCINGINYEGTINYKTCIRNILKVIDKGEMDKLYNVLQENFKDEFKEDLTTPYKIPSLHNPYNEDLNRLQELKTKLK